MSSRILLVALKETSITMVSTASSNKFRALISLLSRLQVYSVSKVQKSTLWIPERRVVSAQMVYTDEIVLIGTENVGLKTQGSPCSEASQAAKNTVCPTPRRGPRRRVGVCPFSGPRCQSIGSGPRTAHERTFRFIVSNGSKT